MSSNDDSNNMVRIESIINHVNNAISIAEQIN